MIQHICCSCVVSSPFIHVCICIVVHQLVYIVQQLEVNHLVTSILQPFQILRLAYCVATMSSFSIFTVCVLALYEKRQCQTGYWIHLQAHIFLLIIKSWDYCKVGYLYISQQIIWTYNSNISHIFFQGNILDCKLCI